jgi:phosphoribosylglycinamide formyltransferase-1
MTTAMPLALGVLVSGNGTNLQAILDATRDGSLAAQVKCVISNQPGVRALERAVEASVPALTIRHQAFETREAFDRALVAALREHGVEWLVLAGFMRVLTGELLGAFPGRVLNIHPSLLPSFPGRDALGQALRHGVKVTGCTVHFVDGGVDSGPIIAQQALEVRSGDDEHSLAERMHAAEHTLLVSVLRDIASGRVRAASPRTGA